MDRSKGRGIYTHGHHEAVFRSYRRRTPENSAGYLLPALRPGLDLLDVGCGPGTITVGLAKHVAPGRVVGIDQTREALEEAKAHAEAQGVGIELYVADMYALPFPASSFDVVHAHQVLQHAGSPVRVLAEMRRVLRPDGIVAVRDCDYAAFRWAPENPLLTRWLEIYQAVARRNGGEPAAGPLLEGWVLASGFRDIRSSSSTWIFTDSESCQWWGDVRASRCEASSFAEQAVQYGLSSREELDAIAAAFREWSTQPDAFFIVPHGEVLARI